jgi:hypothetical protein
MNQPPIVKPGGPAKNFSLRASLFVQEIVVLICNNALKHGKLTVILEVNANGENLLSPVRQWSGDPKVKDYAGNLQFSDKSKAGRKIKNCSRKYL